MMEIKITVKETQEQGKTKTNEHWESKKGKERILQKREKGKRDKRNWKQYRRGGRRTNVQRKNERASERGNF